MEVHARDGERRPKLPADADAISQRIKRDNWARDADRDGFLKSAAHGQKEPYARQQLSLRQRIARDALMSDQQVQAGRLDAHARTSLRIQQNEQALANARTSMLNTQFAAEQQHANRLVALDRATWAR